MAPYCGEMLTPYKPHGNLTESLLSQFIDLCGLFFDTQIEICYLPQRGESTVELVMFGSLVLLPAALNPTFVWSNCCCSYVWIVPRPRWNCCLKFNDHNRQQLKPRLNSHPDARRHTLQESLNRHCAPKILRFHDWLRQLGCCKTGIQKNNTLDSSLFEKPRKSRPVTVKNNRNFGSTVAHHGWIWMVSFSPKVSTFLTQGAQTCPEFHDRTCVFGRRFCSHKQPCCSARPFWSAWFPRCRQTPSQAVVDVDEGVEQVFVLPRKDCVDLITPKSKTSTPEGGPSPFLSTKDSTGVPRFWPAAFCRHHWNSETPRRFCLLFLHA